jgi:putative aldouronate transport system permease protein
VTKRFSSRRPLSSVSRPAGAAIHVVFVAFILFCLIPFLLVLSASFSDEKTITREGFRLIPQKTSLAAYRLLLGDFAQVARSYGITAFVTAAGTLISLVLTASFAYPLYRRDFPYRRHFTVFLCITMLFNGGLVPFYILYTNWLHLRETVTALILPYLMNPFFVIIMRTFFTNTIPDSVVESAKLDGASEITILSRIVLPLSLPAFATVGLFTTLVYWNDWFMSLLFISQPRNMNIQFYLYRTIMNLDFLLRQTAISSSTALVDIPGQTARMAMAIVGIGPIILAYPFFQRYFIKGLTVGAIKG